MNKILFILAFLPLTLFSQDCDELISVTEIDLNFDVKNKLRPDPCGAKPRYNGKSYLRLSPEAGYEETIYNVVINSLTTINEKCESSTVEISRDTIPVNTKLIYGETLGKSEGNYYTVRLELLTKAPKTRPIGCRANLLPDGSGGISGYWVVTYGKYSTLSEAKEAVKEFKEEYPEFCRAYAYKLPMISYQYGYR